MSDKVEYEDMSEKVKEEILKYIEYRFSPSFTQNVWNVSEKVCEFANWLNDGVGLKNIDYMDIALVALENGYGVFYINEGGWYLDEDYIIVDKKVHNPYNAVEDFKNCRIKEFGPDYDIGDYKEIKKEDVFYKGE